MKAAIFVAITLLAGAIVGTMLGLVNQVVVGPFIERAIDIEMENAASSRELINSAQFANYRSWQMGGEIAAGTILGLSIGALFGIVFAYTRPSLPGSSAKRKAIVLAGVMWLVLFMVPALKYPANPPAVGDPETIYYRQSLYIAFLAISGFSALGLAILYRKIAALYVRKVIVPALYAAVVLAAYAALPSNPDEISAPMDLVVGFRLVSGATMTMFWVLLGVTLGSFWDRLKPHVMANIKAK